MKKILLISLIFLSSFGFSQMTGPDDVAGTLITAAVRPNSQLDNMATAYTNEVRGGLHNYERWSQLDSINSARLVQWMLATVADSVGKIYQYDGSAWDELEIGGGLSDAPSDGRFYARKNELWGDINYIPSYWLSNSVFGLGNASFGYNTGTSNIYIFGYGNVNYNTGNNVTGIGYQSPGGNYADDVIAIGGMYTLQENNGKRVIGIGTRAGAFNMGDGVISIGYNANYNPTNAAANRTFLPEDIDLETNWITIPNHNFETASNGQFEVAFSTTGTLPAGLKGGSWHVPFTVIDANTIEPVEAGYITSGGSGVHTIHPNHVYDNMVVIGDYANGNGTNTFTAGDDKMYDFFAGETGNADVHGKGFQFKDGTYQSSAATAFTDAPSDGSIYARRNATWEALAEETVNNYFCTSWAEVKTAVAASNAANGGNIYMSGDIILTDTAHWDLTGVSFYGTANWRVLNTDTASIGSQAFEIVVTAGSPRFYNVQFVGSGNGSDAQTFSTFSSRDLFVLKGNQNIDFINCKFTDIIGGDGDVDIIEFENISLNHSATATFNGCTFTSHNNGTNHQMEYNGFKISANNAGTFYVNVYNQTLGKDYPGLNNSGAKFNVDVTTPTLFQYYSDGSAYGITDITSSTSSNIITGARNQAIPSLSDKMLISFAADGQVYEITLQQLKTLLGI